MTVYLALYKAKGKPGNAVIRWWTGSAYSHCELVVDGVWYSSSIQDKGVRAKVIDPKPGHWDLIPLPSHLAARILKHFEATKGDSYGWLELLRCQILNTNFSQTGAAFCSEWCAAAIGIPNPASYSPRTLAELVTWALGDDCLAGVALA